MKFTLITGTRHGSLVSALVRSENLESDGHAPEDYFLDGVEDVKVAGEVDITGPRDVMSEIGYLYVEDE
jgi:hypothetical protein